MTRLHHQAGISHRPFKPFTLITSDGGSVPVRHAEQIGFTMIFRLSSLNSPMALCT